MIRECSELRKNRIEDQMRQLMIAPSFPPPSAGDVATNLLDMLKDRYESVVWLVLVYGITGPYTHGRAGENVYSATGGSFEATAYPVTG